MNLGKVISTEFKGANGYTVTIENGIYTFLYSHVSPYFLVYAGEYVYKGQIIAKVGPKNVYGVLNNPYKDSNGNPTNGATTRSTPSFYNKKRRQSRQSFRLFLKLTYLRLRLHEACIQNNSHYILLVRRFYLPNQAQLHYYILGILFHLLICHNLQ